MRKKLYVTRTTGREAYRAGHYDRSLIKLSGEVAIRRPKARGARLAMATVGRYRWRETSAEEAMIEACLASRIEGVAEFFWGPGASASTVPDYDEKAFSSVEERLNHPLERACPYACVDGI